MSNHAFQSGGVAFFLLSFLVGHGLAQETIMPPSEDLILPTVVEVRTVDGVATEPAWVDPNTDPAVLVDPAVFQVHRMGPTNIDLVVFYRMHGVAENGVDYARLSGELLIPAGHRAARLVVEPLADELKEGMESVIVEIVPPLCIAIYPPPPECYQVGGEGRAMATIRDDATTPVNAPPLVKITAPESGAVFKVGAAISVSVVTVDPDGYAPQVAFFADGVLIAEQVIDFIVPPPPGEPIHFEFRWEKAPPGGHVLTAVASDNQGARGVSEPVRVFVEGELDIPEVNVVATDPEAAEPDPVPEGMLRPIILNPGRFVVSRRGGDMTLPLTVYFMLGGTAQNGIDYDRVPMAVTIPSGAAEAAVTIVPLDDPYPEPKESVVLTLIPPPMREPMVTEDGRVMDIWPAPYLVGPHARAEVYILDNDVPTDVPPKVALVRPANGSIFVAPATVGLAAQAADLDGRVVQVEFFANDRSLGVVTAEELDRSVLYPFHLTWEHVGPGSYRLMAVATDNDGLQARSEPVYIRVVEEPPPPGDLPVVRIKAVDPVGAETGRYPGSPTLTFRVSRDEATEANLAVYLHIGGRAINGEDYEPVRPAVVIPAGHRSVDVVIRPLDDDLREGPESVVLSLVMPPERDPALDATLTLSPTYLVGRPARAGGIILDNDQDRPPCLRLPDGLFHLCRPGEDGTCYRIEASNDTEHWEVLVENTVVDGAIHFVDPDGDMHRFRFYRVIRVPCDQP